LIISTYKAHINALSLPLISNYKLSTSVCENRQVKNGCHGVNWAVQLHAQFTPCFLLSAYFFTIL